MQNATTPDNAKPPSTDRENGDMTVEEAEELDNIIAGRFPWTK